MGTNKFLNFSWEWKPARVSWFLRITFYVLSPPIILSKKLLPIPGSYMIRQHFVSQKFGLCLRLCWILFLCHAARDHRTRSPGLSIGTSVGRRFKSDGFKIRFFIAERVWFLEHSKPPLWCLFFGIFFPTCSRLLLGSLQSNFRPIFYTFSSTQTRIYIILFFWHTPKIIWPISRYSSQVLCQSATFVDASLRLWACFSRMN